MSGTYYLLDRDRLLEVAPPEALQLVLAGNERVPLVVLLTASGESRDPSEIDAVVRFLLTSGCTYFVCFGSASETLHDCIDEIIVDCMGDESTMIMTTWHDDESVSEVVDFFVDLAASDSGALLLAVIEERDAELASALARRAEAFASSDLPR